MKDEELIAMANKSGAFIQLSTTPQKDLAFLRSFAQLAFEKGRQQGMKQERALWELSKSTQEIGL